jgi:hypothetical protein
LFANKTGTQNLATGTNGLYANTTGSFNVANGVNALRLNTTGSSNTALGTRAGYNLTTGNNNIDIANQGLAGDAAKIRIGTSGTQTAAFLAGVNGVTIPGPTKTVVVNANGQLGTAPAGSAPPAPGNGTAQIRRQQHEIDQLKAENAKLQRQLDQLSHLRNVPKAR